MATEHEMILCETIESVRKQRDAITIEMAEAIEQYVKALNWLQGNIFEHYMDRETKEMRFKLAPHAMTLAKSLKGDSLFGAALRAFNTD